jgi:hypothetical protein
VADAFRPTAAAYRRAAAAGFELDQLRDTDPTSFRMFSAEEVCLTSVELAEQVGERLFATFPDRDLFQLPDAVVSRVRLLAFPPLDREEQQRWEDELAALADRWPEGPVYFRVVEDLRGVTRELALPVAPDGWAGEPVVVGPFDDRAAAYAFGRSATADGPLGYDLFTLGSGWICDLFLADDPALGEGRAAG